MKATLFELLKWSGSMGTKSPNKGKRQSTQSVSSLLGLFPKDVSHLNNAMYHFLVTLKGERLFNGKLFLIK